MDADGKTKSVGVGSPNPLGCGRGNPAPTMDTAPQIVPHLAPAGRHVYSTAAYTKHNKAPAGRHMASV